MSSEIIKKNSLGENKLEKNRVNIDVLKRKIYEQERKEKLHGKLSILCFCIFICLVGIFIST